ncbi:MAG: CehA/McbA family metallohydrolase [Myxococcales bacterium]|nr:CehA/McbA family metallohydrolase [Myxococcales bacterium]MDH5306656.1 CehA/McbA family metallohydrolase [Myxococcales bacterium]
MRTAVRAPSRAALLLVLCAAAPSLAGSAGREPVLKQIRVPHSYYYREMYLPQPTSGPSAVDWSPDGTTLVYSMQGRLWRQRVGSDEAEQLTSGASYDYQPDWSPDGRSIAYVAYRDDAMELRLLDLETLTSRPLTANGAVNVEPRFSPDGQRLAFVSTLFEGRWHIFRMDLRDGEPAAPRRLTEDRKSDLPRYYYSAFDHYLSPTWSPDGQEILFVSNRGHIWGSGGFWRMRAKPGAKPREIRYEETTWKARPDWSPDGRRVLYASYAGRAWHQLWIMTDEGGDPFPLTYGAYDITAPRWSPDGRKIAYISNAGGDTSLWIQEIPGGRRQEIRAAQRRTREPSGRLRLRILDAAGAGPVPARVSVTDADGRGYAPDAARWHADDGFDRSQRPFEYQYFHARGSAELTLPVGEAQVEILRGIEVRPFRRSVKIEAGAVVEVEAPLERIADLTAEGWQSGDLHVHMNYGGAYRNDPAELAFQAAAEDLRFVENLIVNKEQRVPDIAYFDGVPHAFPDENVVIDHAQEFHTSFWGHVGLLGLRDHFLIPDYVAYANTAAASLYPTNAAIVDLARAQGGVAGYVHPFDSAPDPFDAKTPLTNEFPVDVALGKVDYYEAVGFVADLLANQDPWYRLLNCGFRLPTGAGTDAMANFASLRGPVGLNRVYAQTPAPLDHRRFLDALVAGRTFATNGPLLTFTLGGKEIGEAIELPAGSHRLEVRASLRSIVPVDHFEVVVNGEVVASLPLDATGTAGRASQQIALDRSGWVLLRAWNSKATHPVRDTLPFATTSPIYVTLGGAPVRSPEDADYFIAWVDRLMRAAGAHDGYNTAEEKAAVLKVLSDARAVFVARAVR